MKTFNDLVNSFKDSDNVSIIDRKEYRKFSYTYKELYILCRKFAGFLRENNVKKGDRIIVWNYNGIEYAVILLGAFLEGVIVVPVDLRSNIEFVSKIQKEVKARIIFQTRYKPGLRNSKTIFTEQILDMLDDIRIRKDSSKISENDIAEIIYTSGTTGAPKGVVLTNKNLISNINALNRTEKVESSFRFLSVLPLSHVFEQTVGFFVPLSSRASVAYMKTLKTRALFDAFREEKITNAVVVPRLLELIHSGILQKVRNKNKEKQFLWMLRAAEKLPSMLKKILFRKIHRKFGNNINYFICGGAPLDKGLEQFYNAIGILILQGYGLTETSPVLAANTSKDRKAGSVGKVVPDVKVRIDDGEVLARGITVTEGYYRNPARTKELFRGGWMKTGDLGYFDDDGFLHLKGRKKDMIVTSAGVNVYPEDIESAINKIDGVRDSCVMGMEGARGEDVYAVLLLEKGISAGHIISEANKKLDSSQKIRDYSVWTYEDFPRTTTMKIKRFAVREAVQKKAKPAIIRKKNKVYAILSQLTGKKISAGSSLQDLGLSSIDRVELVSLMEQEFNLEVDEEKILPDTKVKDLETIVRMRKQVEERTVFRKWPLSLPARIAGYAAKKLFLSPFVRVFSRPAVEGKENLEGVKGPAIFVSNHQSHLDTPIILMELPSRFSQKTAVAALQEYFFTPNLLFKSIKRRASFYLLTLFFNIYPFPQKKGFRRSIGYTGKLISDGWNILFYPEGERTGTGQINRFMQGIGMLAVEMKVPVIPLRIEGVFDILPRWKIWPRFGRARVKIGKPIMIRPGSYIEAAGMIEKAVRDL